MRRLNASILLPALFTVLAAYRPLFAVTQSRDQRTIHTESLVLAPYRIGSTLTECEVVLTVATLIAVTFYTVRRLTALVALSICRKHALLVQPDGELIVVEEDGLNLTVSLLATTVEAFMSRRAARIIDAGHIGHASTARALLTFRTLNVEAYVAAFTRSTGIGVELPALLPGAFKVAHAALELLLACSVPSTLHAWIGLVAVRIVSAFLANATHAVLGAAIALAMVIPMTIWIAGCATVDRSEQSKRKNTNNESLQ